MGLPGESEAKVRQLFQEAAALAPCIIFIGAAPQATLNLVSMTVGALQTHGGCQGMKIGGHKHFLTFPAVRH